MHSIDLWKKVQKQNASGTVGATLQVLKCMTNATQVAKSTISIAELLMMGGGIPGMPLENNKIIQTNSTKTRTSGFNRNVCKKIYSSMHE